MKYLQYIVAKTKANKIGILSKCENTFLHHYALREMLFGKCYFIIAICLCEAMFLATVLTNIEVWYGVSKSEIEELEILDIILLRHIGLPSSTPSEFLYLETGCLDIGTILKMRRKNPIQFSC